MKDLDITPMKSDLVRKGDDHELQELKDRFNVFSDVENISNFKNIYLPRMKKFFDSVDALHASNADMREIIVNFDKKLSLKLNKSQLITLKDDLNQAYIPNEFKETYNMRFEHINL